MKKKFLIIAFLAVCIICGYCLMQAKTVSVSNAKAQQALTFCKKNGYNTNYCFFVDFSQSTQVKRFYVYDFNKKKIIFTCYCAHGNDGTGNTNQQADINSLVTRLAATSPV